MRCAGCGHDNRGERRFCAGCGAALATGCTKCGFANLPGERFCGGCGTTLEAAAPAGERRQVAILFADLAGYTRMSSTLDPEEVHRLLTGFFEVVDGACTRFGGTIDKHIGDNVMAIFGAPIAHGDDPERAVRAAVAIHREVAAYSARVGRALLVHVGIAYGEVIASGLGSAHHQEYTVTGDAVNLAARLQDKAVGGETMISDAVQAAAAKITVCEPVGDVAVKGLAAPVKVWKLLDVRATATAPVRLVGRARELDEVVTRLARVRRERRGALIVVRGEAGIGKSTLVAELARRATDDGFEVHRGQVLDFGQGMGAGAIPTIVAGLLGAPPGAEDNERRAALDAASRRGDIDAVDAVSLAALLGLDTVADDDGDRDRRGRQHAALSALIASRPVPILLVVEDVHWADAATMGRLRACTTACAARDGVVLVTTRIDGDPLDGPWRAAAGGEVVVIDLEPLGDADALGLAAEHLVDHDLIARCVERAGGNPLFLEQLVHAATRDAALPGTLQGVVIARVDRLPVRDRTAIAAASVAGQQFEVALVRALTGDATWTPDELIARRLVRALDGDALAFHHALILDGVYASLTHARRKELHRAAAAFHAGRDGSLHAEHLERATDPGAAAAWRAAAEHEVAIHDVDRGLALVERGLACATTTADRHALHALAGQLQNELGEGRAAAREWKAALDTAPDAEARGRAQIGLGGACRYLGRFPEALDHLREAEALFAPEAHPIPHAQIAYLRGSVEFAQGDVAGCRASHERALDHARRAGAREWEARALSGIGDALYLEGRFEDGRRAFVACAELAESLGLHRYAVLNRIMVADSMQFLMMARTADDMLLELVDRAAAIRAGRAEALALESIVFGRALCGDFDAAEAIMDRALTRCRELGMQLFESAILAAHAEILFHRGDREAAHAISAQLEAVIAILGSSMLRHAYMGLRCVIGDAEERADILAQYDHRLPGTLQALQFRSSAIEACLSAGEWDHALGQAALLAEEGTEIPLGRFMVERARAVVAWGRGDHGPDVARELRRLRAVAAEAGLHRHIPDPDAA